MRPSCAARFRIEFDTVWYTLSRSSRMPSGMLQAGCAPSQAFSWSLSFTPSVSASRSAPFPNTFGHLTRRKGIAVQSPGLLRRMPDKSPQCGTLPSLSVLQSFLWDICFMDVDHRKPPPVLDLSGEAALGDRGIALPNHLSRTRLRDLDSPLNSYDVSPPSVKPCHPVPPSACDFR